jgi:hypothetical protein
MGEDTMTIYITQGRYTDQAIKGFVAKPEDRSAQVRKLMKAAGGKMIAYYVTLGEYDFLVISEGKDLTGMMGRHDHDGCEESHGRGEEDRRRVPLRRQVKRRGSQPLLKS